MMSKITVSLCRCWVTMVVGKRLACGTCIIDEGMNGSESE